MAVLGAGWLLSLAGGWGFRNGSWAWAAKRTVWGEGGNESWRLHGGCLRCRDGWGLRREDWDKDANAFVL